MPLIGKDISLLVIEDNCGDYTLIEDYLNEEIPHSAIHHAKTLAGAKKDLTSGIHFDSILLDLSLPDAKGEKLVNEVVKLAGDIPVIVLTGYANTDFGIRTLSLGISDYLLKDDLQAPLLIKSIAYSMERKKINQALKISEKKYKDFFQFNPLPMWVYDVETQFFLNVNEAAIKHYGYSENEFLSMTINDIRLEKDVAQLKETIRNNKKSGLPYQGLWKHVRKNGQVIEVEVKSKHVQFDGKGARLVLANDITEKLSYSREVLKSNAKLNVAQEIGKLGYWDFDMVTKELFWSDEVFKILKVPKETFEVTNGAFFSLVHPDDKSRLKKANGAAQTNGEDFNIQHRIRCPDGEVRHVHQRGSIVYGDDDRPIRFEGIIQDITESKKNEQEREHLIRELTQNNKDLLQFSYITSHNLRAPLSNLTGLLSLLEDIPIQDDALKEILEGFRSSTRLLNETVDDLTKVLYIKNNPSVKQEKIAFEEIFEKTCKQVDNLIREHQPVLVFNFKDAPTVTFHKAYLESIVMNLLTNAIKYKSDSRRLKIEVITKKSKDSVQMSFQDNGSGLDLKRYKNRIFGLYQKFHPHTDSKGLGLYLVKSHLEALGGKIEIKSEVDAGTEFLITFKNTDHVE